MALTKLLVKKPNVPLQSCTSICRRLQSSEDYEYIQRSKVPTFHFQPSLPRLPIPELEKTCKRYLEAQKPLLSSEDYDRTKGHVKKFCNGEGKELQKKLKEKDKRNKHTSYISDLWFDMYLRDRVPLPINYNPTVVLVNNPKPEYNDQTVRACNMLISSLRFMKALRAEILDPEVFHLNPKKSDTDLFRTVSRLLPSSLSWYGAYLLKAFPLDMSQYDNLFNNTRIPEIGKDRLAQDKTATHTLVMRNGHFYILQVLDRDGNILKPGDILACMKYILDDNVSPAEYPVGVLTAGNRDTWSQDRKHLENIGNAEALKLIDSSLFNLCLDNIEIRDDYISCVRNFLHGDGCNRWFDKSFSLLMSKDGITAVNFEHSWGDGVAVLRYLQDVFKDSSNKPLIHPDSQPSNIDATKLVRRLEFKLDDTARNAVDTAKKQYEAFYKSLDFNLMEFLNFGKKVCKQHGVSPDSIMQLGFQLAYYKQTGKFAATYESCSTAAFRHGRTETMRPCTMATKAFCEAVARQNRPSHSDLRGMINTCSEIHTKLTKNAAMGQGFDRHLFAMRRLAEESGGPMPSLYEDPAYAAINHNILSTSTLSSDAVLAGAFGPVVKDGYGIGYSIFQERLGTIVSSYPPHRDGSDFSKCLRSSFQDIYNILNRSESVQTTPKYAKSLENVRDYTEEKRHKERARSS